MTDIAPEFEVVNEDVPVSKVVTMPHQYMAIYANPVSNWWAAADTREKARAAFDRFMAHGAQKPLYRVYTFWDAEKLAKIAAFLEMPSPSGMIH
ncbi:hypothetical protein [Bradyrhizobium sp. Tv2a-2]|uniref:hypothetical protein n=1 Tax=Bradyrhizobium sp. Tv2a-2 TaxID=113395 RepID=UPI000415FB13|nr:hypothetical protein [Bradyrhizobium sp. Tv2a-2]